MSASYDIVIYIVIMYRIACDIQYYIRYIEYYIRYRKRWCANRYVWYDIVYGKVSYTVLCTQYSVHNTVYSILYIYDIVQCKSSSDKQYAPFAIMYDILSCNIYCGICDIIHFNNRLVYNTRSKYIYSYILVDNIHAYYIDYTLYTVHYTL